MVTKMKMIINGAAGRMGRELLSLSEQRKDELEAVALVDMRGGDGILPSLSAYDGPADVIVDFSFHTSAMDLCEYAVNRGTPVVIATTGHTPEEMKAIEQAAATVPVFRSANMSLGIAVLADLAKRTAAMFPDADIEIVETHHNRKADAPSGTALLLADEIKKVRNNAEIVLDRCGKGKRTAGDIGISSIRVGNVVGDHEIIIGTDTQIITLKHQAMTRSIFAEGAVSAAAFIVGKPAGLYDMFDLIKAASADQE